MDLQLIVDNYSTHKHPKAKQWISVALAIPSAFHSHQFVLVKFGGTVVWAEHRETGSWGVVKSVKELIEALETT